MTRFNQVIVDKTASTVEVGTGLIWDDVYQALDGTGLNVVGGRVSGVGVAGFTLGGGEWSSSSTVSG
jgi:FAD/FMN-containing dehydrogenase